MQWTKTLAPKFSIQYGARRADTLFSCVCACAPGLHKRRNETSISTHTKKGTITFSCSGINACAFACTYACATPVYILVSSAYACAYAYAFVVLVIQTSHIFHWKSRYRLWLLGTDGLLFYTDSTIGSISNVNEDENENVNKAIRASRSFVHFFAVNTWPRDETA